MRSKGSNPNVAAANEKDAMVHSFAVWLRWL